MVVDLKEILYLLRRGNIVHYVHMDKILKSVLFKHLKVD